MFNFGPTELILILAVVLVVFGAGKLSGVGKAVGKSVREFKEEVQTEETEERTQQSAEPADNEPTAPEDRP